MQSAVHYFLHLFLPLIVAKYFFKDNWARAYIVFMMTMIVDIDHVLAQPIFQNNRCSICFHPLHSLYAICIYIALLFFKKDLRLIGLGLLMHMATDFIDCIFTYKTNPTYVIDDQVLSLLRWIFG